MWWFSSFFVDYRKEACLKSICPEDFYKNKKLIFTFLENYLFAWPKKGLDFIWKHFSEEVRHFTEEKNPKVFFLWANEIICWLLELVMDRITVFGFGNVTEKWVERKFSKLIFPFSPNFGPFFLKVERTFFTWKKRQKWLTIGGIWKY